MKYVWRNALNLLRICLVLFILLFVRNAKATFECTDILAHALIEDARFDQTITLKELPADWDSISVFDRLSSPPPRYHVGNLQGQHTTSEVVMHFVPGTLLRKQNLVLRMGDRPEQLKLKEFSADFRFAKFIDPLGQRRYIEFQVYRTPIEDHFDVKFIEHIDIHKTPFKSGAALRGPPNLQRTDVLNEVDQPQLAAFMAHSYATASATAKDPRYANQLNENLNKLANDVLVRSRNKESLSISTLEHWNKLINHQVPTSTYTEKLAGVSRGKKRIIFHEGASLVMDTSNLQTYAGDVFAYLPANQVQARLAKLVHFVNTLNRNSTLVDIAHIYQEFIIIHPFIDGNGRTARALVDFALLKAGFPTLPSDPRTRQALYQTPEELAELLAETYPAHVKD